ncbi:MAG: hypothetical protein KGH77_04025 [Candidatus Micrarchaeota archaeon]|nr:hypothetical protein [Candidatus Micrarchaeota archaeon]MDE1864568.1 hypothetical protein [Candidatus Micrarchaeota archaeon]
MGKKGGTRHMKRLASPPYMKLKRKEAKFVARPMPGRHTMANSIALLTFIKEKLGIANSSSEARRAIVEGRIEINGRVRREPKYSIGFGDVIKVIPSNESYILTFGKYGAFEAKKAEKNEKRTLKVVGKYLAKGKKQTIRLNNGNIYGFDKEVNVNDSVVIEDRKIIKVIKLEEGTKCMVTSGIHAPAIGKITQVKKGTALRDATVTIQGESGSFDTLLSNVIAIGA